MHCVKLLYDNMLPTIVVFVQISNPEHYPNTGPRIGYEKFVALVANAVLLYLSSDLLVGTL